MPPLDPAATSADEPPILPETLDGFRSTSFVSGHTIDEYRNGWSVMRRDRNGTILSERHFFKSRGHDRLMALEHAAREHAKHKGGS